ncbi:MAG: tetratricopeptide repeat protein [bacterium]
MTPSSDDTDSNDPDGNQYSQLIHLGFKQQVILFSAILFIVGSSFYWFSSTMTANSNKKVQQARKILDRAKDAPEELNPLTLELESMVHRTERERNWILGQLTSDSFPNQLNQKLKNRYLNETARYRLGPNWKRNLPRNLEKWASKQRGRRANQVKAFMGRLKTILSRLEDRIERVETIRDEESIRAGEHGGSVKRYLSLKSEILNKIDSLQANLGEPTAQYRIPDPVFDGAVALVDPLTKLSLHFRGFSALTAAPAAYYHAERLLYDALRIDPKNPAAYFYLGKVYRELNMDVTASEHTLRALKWDSTYKRDSILKTFRQRLEEKPNDPRRRYDLGWALYETGHKEEAKKHLQKVLLQEYNKDSMVRVLAKKRLNYINTGESLYNKLTNF